MYNNSINWFTSLSPFEIVHGYRHRKPLDLVPLSPHVCTSKSMKAFTQHVHDLHLEIHKKLYDNYHKYKLDANLYWDVKEFNIGDYVMVRTKCPPFRVGSFANCRPVVFEHSRLFNTWAPIPTFLNYISWMLPCTCILKNSI